MEAAVRHFNPRAPCGARRWRSVSSSPQLIFQSTRPLRGATCGPCILLPREGLFQSTRPLRGATYIYLETHTLEGFQSTRPLRGATSGRSRRARRGAYFNPRAPCGARLSNRPVTVRDALFQSTRPLRGATPAALGHAAPSHISIHAPLAGRDCTTTRSGGGRCTFQSTRPLRGATFCQIVTSYLYAFQSTRPLRGATTTAKDSRRKWPISIHAPLAGRDSLYSRPTSRQMHFNPRAPCGARRLDDLASVREKLFQSTRPLRGATLKSAVWDKDQAISIHAPLAGRDGYRGLSVRRLQYFNPRAPCGARRIVYCVQLEISPFQSTRPLRGATPSAPRVLFFRRISIHAPLAGRDALTTGASCAAMNFNPRAPCGARRGLHGFGLLCSHFNPRAPCGARRPLIRYCASESAFQSTRPLRGATGPLLEHCVLQHISIHAPLAGRDALKALWDDCTDEISIHAPLAGRDDAAFDVIGRADISIHAPLAGRDVHGRYALKCLVISIHAPLAGRDR